MRAQLARISHGTQLCPKGYIEIDEESGQEKLADEGPDTSTGALSDLANWGHRYGNILNNGRCTHAPPADMPEEQVEEYMAKQAEEDKVEERFRAVNDEGYAGVKGLEFAWMNKTKGDSQLYENKGDEGSQFCYAVNVVSSLRWPGAMTVAKGGKFVSIYVGDGNKRGDFSYNPTETPEVNSDPKE